MSKPIPTLEVSAFGVTGDVMRGVIEQGQYLVVAKTLGRAAAGGSPDNDSNGTGLRVLCAMKGEPVPYQFVFSEVAIQDGANGTDTPTISGEATFMHHPYEPTRRIDGRLAIEVTDIPATRRDRAKNSLRKLVRLAPLPAFFELTMAAER